MKKLAALALLLLCGLAHAGPWDLLLNQRNANDDGNILRIPLHPSTPGVFAYDPTNNIPLWVTLGSNLTIVGTELNATGAASQVNSDWNAVTGPALILNKPTTFPPNSHTHPATDISDSTAVGRSVLTAATAAAARAAIGAGTSSFDGAYASLTSIPSTFPPSAHTHVIADVTGLQAALNAKYDASNPTGYITSAALSPYLTSSTAASTYATQASLTSGLAGKFNQPTGTTAQYVRGDGSLAAFPAVSTPTQAPATRVLNTAFQISATRWAWAGYSVQCTITASISGGQNCDVVLEIASDSGFTTNVQTLAILGDGQTYTLAVAIQGVQPTTKHGSGWVPPGYFARLRPVQNTGAPTFLFRAGQEVLM